ncbi:nifU protein, putative [Plasmodium ovale wallikeri]|uniref:NifU protein, putative n=2 Tax=Plasmodium ovale TaxID=36330 RepID=A0A1A8ZFI5_PLAOA|nr:nifU protein, putative [Plasmodium ovale wallikeri]SBT43255.1 nifU protein, putative [Plasmodium ovale wallikeri]SBT78391.1 iron sulfur cluster assembly protein, putative [Plasmodium ovale]
MRSKLFSQFCHRRGGFLYANFLRGNNTNHSSLVCARGYSDNVKDHFNKPRNVGSFDKNEKNVGTSIVGKASCGDVIKLQLKIEDDVIKDARFMAFGCGSAIASSSYATELIKGKTIDEALKIKNVDIASHLSLPPVKIHCSLLAEDAIKHAIKNYREKVIN